MVLARRWFVSVLLVAACSGPQRGGGNTDTCSDKRSEALKAGSEFNVNFCTAADCPLAPEDQGNVIERYCTNSFQSTCAPCNCPSPGIPTSPNPRCNAEPDNPAGVRYVTRCELERGNVDHPVGNCPKEAPSSCTCHVKVPDNQTLRCRCSCPAVPVLH